MECAFFWYGNCDKNECAKKLYNLKTLGRSLNVTLAPGVHSRRGDSETACVNLFRQLLAGDFPEFEIKRNERVVNESNLTDLLCSLHQIPDIFSPRKPCSLQVLGYFIKYAAEVGRPPLVFVLSEKSAKLMLFPFVNENQEQAVVSVLLPHFPLWCDGRDGAGVVSFSCNFLVLLLLVCGSYDTTMAEFKYPGEGTPKKHLKGHILT